MKYKLIASDMDGTLIGHDYILGEKNKKAIKKAVDAGIKFVLCSGRSPSSLACYAKELELDKQGYYHIGYNGNVIYEATTLKQLMPSALLNIDLAMEIYREVKTILPNTKVIMSTTKDTLLYEADLAPSNISDGGYASSPNINEFGSFAQIANFDDLTEDLMKIIVMDNNDKLQHLFKNMIDKVKGRYTIVFSSHNFLEFMPANINKGVALTKLAEHFGINMSQVVACGDNFNDMEMIQAAGLGAAMKNAVEPLKDVANYVTKNDAVSGGVAEVIELVLRHNS